MSNFLIAAALAAAACVLVHVGLGGRRILAPVLAQDDMPKREKARFHYLWHLTTVLLLGIAAAYAYALATGLRELAIVGTGMALAAMGWTLMFILPRGYGLRRFPQWALFGTVAQLGLAGLWW